MTIAEPPNDTDAEKAVIGSGLVSPLALDAVAGWLKPAMFYQQRHARIYTAMLALHERKTPIDTRTMVAELRARGWLEACGGIPYLAELVNAVPSSTHAEHYGAMVRKKARQRQAIELGARIAELGSREGDEAALTEQVHALSTRYVTSDTRGGPTTIADVMAAVKTFYERDEAPGVMTSLYDYDKLTGGLRPGHLVIVAGRPAHGKSAFAGTVACNVAQDGKGVLFFSMEMDRVELGIRILSMVTGIDGTAMQDRALEEDDLAQMLATMPQVAGWPLWLEDVTVGLGDIRACVLRHIAEYGPLACVVVDYLQLVKPDDRYRGNRQMEVAAIARGLKELAQEAHTTVIALSQLNRDIERRSKDELRPTLADLRESGEIEQAANQVTFVIRPSEFGLKTITLDGYELATESLGLVYVEKQRGRPTGLVKLRFNAPCTRFENLVMFREMEGY